MSKQVWNFKIRVNNEIELPKMADFLSIQMQAGEIVAWFVVMPKEEKITRYFTLYGTGHDIPLSAKYLGTVMPNDGLVLHLFGELM